MGWGVWVPNLNHLPWFVCSQLSFSAARRKIRLPDKKFVCQTKNSSARQKIRLPDKKFIWDKTLGENQPFCVSSLWFDDLLLHQSSKCRNLFFFLPFFSKKKWRPMPAGWEWCWLHGGGDVDCGWCWLCGWCRLCKGYTKLLIWLRWCWQSHNQSLTSF